MGNPVIAGSSFAAGLQVEFLKTYEATYKTNMARLGMVMNLDLTSDKDAEKYFYWLATPHPRIWRRGESISTKNFDGVQFSVTNYDWARKIEWHHNDLADDQTKSLEGHARQLGQNFALLKERLFFQLLLNSTDADLLPAVPNAPDGAAFFAATAGGVDRFGLSGGNIVSGGGVTTSDLIRTDFWAAVSALRRFQDGEGQPLHPDGVLDGRYVIIYGAANEEKFREAFKQARTVETNTVGSTGTAAGVSNTVMESGLKFELWPTQRITDNDWFVFAADSPTKSVFYQTREALSENVQTLENSDTARSTQIEGVQWKERGAAGLSLPIQAVKVNN